MSYRLSQRVRRLFDVQIQRPGFAFELDKEAVAPAGDRVYRFRMDEKFWCFVHLEMWKQDRFTLTIAWSEDGIYPAYLIGQSPVDVPECDIKASEPVDGAMRFRLAQLWDGRLGGIHCWHVSECEDGVSVEAQVQDALRLLREVGVPYLRRAHSEYCQGGDQQQEDPR